MKRILFIVFCILNVLTLSSCGISSEKPSTTTTQPYNKVTIENINDFEIDYNEDNTATITKYVGEPVEVIVPNTVIKDGIEYSVKTIGRDAFRNNRRITYVFISEGITHIELGAFYGCEYLVRISIPNSAEYIGDSAFMMCWGLRQDYIEYDNGYYLGNSNNPFIILMDVKDTPFESLEINPEAKFIYYQSISGASNLKSLYIPENIIQIGTNIVGGCFKLTSIVVDKNNRVYDSRDNCNAIIETEPNRLICTCKTSTIPNTVKRLGVYSLNSDFETINIPYGVQVIEANACVGEDNITSLVIPDSVSIIEAGAFEICHSLKTVILPANLRTIERHTFLGCSSLESIVIPYTVTTIKESAFERCSRLLKVYYGGKTQGHINISFEGRSTGEIENATWYYLTTNGATETESGYWWYYDVDGTIKEVVNN